jgi:nucleotide-binding universal stress UspA family protein
MFKKVVVPLDGTPQAAAALPLARSIAHTTDGSLLLLRVTDEVDRSGDPERYLQAVAKELQDGTVECIVRHGTAVDEIVAIARDLNADLIVMATHGRAGIERILAGSVAERVLTHSKVPLVLVRPGGKRVTHLKTLLVPTDGTAGAALALASAVGLARAGDARVVLVEAIEPIPLWVYAADYGVAPTYLDPAWEDEAVSAADTYVRGLVSRLQAAGVKAEGQARKGGAVAVIEAVADEADADLIIMSTHAYTGPARTVLGSTADALVRTAKRPVLLIRRLGSAPDYEAAHAADADLVEAPAG